MKKIAFITAHEHPQTDNTLKILEDNFPDYKFDIIRIVDLLKKEKIIVLFNVFFTFKEYGLDLLTNRKKFKDVFFRTVFLFKKIKKMVNNKLREGDYYFSFQIGSVYDTSLEGLPHFIYTDHTHLANLGYPLFDKKCLLSSEMIELEKSIYKNATLNFTYSSNITNSIISEYSCPVEKVACVYAGSNVDIENMTSDIERYKNKNILFVGIDWERKGGPDLLEAFEKVLKKHPDSKLIIIGANPKIKNEKCIVLGRIPIEKVPDYYKNASVFCMPTKREPFGLVYLEAMLYRLPVVATNIGAIPDFVQNDTNGYLVEPGDVKGIAEALIKLLDNPQKCMTFGEYGYKLVTEKYTWEIVGKRMKEYITKSIGKSKNDI